MIQVEDKTITGELAAICGPGQVISTTERLAPFAVDGRLPRWAASPASPEQIASILQLAGRSKLAVLPLGSGTKSGMGGIPTAVDLVLATCRLDQIADYDGPNLTVSVGAGMTLGALRRTLAADGKLLPLDAPFDEATVGGVIATNQSGPKRLLYGSARDVVLGLRAVLACGDIVRFGGKVMKNVAGYDMTKLMIGSWGTLGIITEVTFRLLPLPEDEASLLAAFPSLEQAGKAVKAILALQLVPSALELANPLAWSRAAGGVGLTAAAGVYRLAIAFEGFHEAVERQVQQVTGIIHQEGAGEVAALRGDEQARLWRALRDFSRAAQAGEGTTVALKVSVPIASVEELLRAAEKTAAENRVECAVLAHAGCGQVCTLLRDPEGTHEAALVKTIGAIQIAAGQAGGSALVESAPPAVKAQSAVWGQARPEWSLMRRLKSQFDPAGILNPGRFVGGI